MASTRCRALRVSKEYTIMQTEPLFEYYGIQLKGMVVSNKDDQYDDALDDTEEELELETRKN
jgi:hypothetical protein